MTDFNASTSEALPPEVSAEQARVRDIFLTRAHQAGAKIQTPDGTIILPKRANTVPQEEADAMPATPRWVDMPTQEVEVIQADDPRARKYEIVDDPQDTRIVIDLDIEEIDEKTIYLLYRDPADLDEQGKPRKKERAVTIPAPKMDVAFRAGRYQFLIEEKYRAMLRTKSDQEANRLDAELRTLNTKLIQLLIPTMPLEQLAKFNLRALTQIVDVAGGMVQEAMTSGPSPVSYIKRVYRLVGRPYGDNDRGLIKWLQEQFAPLEEEYGSGEPEPPKR